MASLADQLATIRDEKSKRCIKFLKVYKGNLQWNILQTWESWNYVKTFDKDLDQCDVLFHTCWQNTPSDYPNSLESKIGSSSISYSSFATKDIEFMTEDELTGLDDKIQLLLDLLIPYFQQPQVQVLINFLIYKYDFTIRYSESFLVNFIHYHDTKYFYDIASLLTPSSSNNLSFLIPKPNEKAADSRGIPKNVVLNGVIHSFSVYKMISDLVHRLVFVRNKYEKSADYISFYNILNLFYIEEMGKSIDGNEMRFILNRIFNNLGYLEYPEVYNADLCALSILVTKVSLNITVQRSLITALFDPLLHKIGIAGDISPHLKTKFRNAIRMLITLLQHQKERLLALPDKTTKSLFDALSTNPSLLSTLHISNHTDILDMSRLCSLLFHSTIKLCKSIELDSNPDVRAEIDTSQYVHSLLSFFSETHIKEHYIKLILLNVIDEIQKIASLCHTHDETLITIDRSKDTVSVSLNRRHHSILSYLQLILTRLHTSYNKIFETTISDVLSDIKDSIYYVETFLFICNSTSYGCISGFLYSVNKAFATKIDMSDEILPENVTSDNIYAVIKLYLEPGLPSQTRLQIYTLLADAIAIYHESDNGGFDALIPEFFSATLNDPNLANLLCNNTTLWNRISVKYSLSIILTHIQNILNDMDRVTSVNIPFDLIKSGDFFVIDMEPFFESYATTLKDHKDLSDQLLAALSVLVKIYNSAPNDARVIVNRSCLHFMILLNIVSGRNKDLKSISYDFLISNSVDVKRVDIKLLISSAYSMLTTFPHLVTSNSSNGSTSGNTEIYGYIAYDTNSLKGGFVPILYNRWILSHLLHCLLNGMHKGMLDNHIEILHMLSTVLLRNICTLIKTCNFNYSGDFLWCFLRTFLKLITITVHYFGESNFNKLLLMEHMLIILSDDTFHKDFNETIESYSILNPRIWLKHCFECCRLSAFKHNSKSITSAYEGNDYTHGTIDIFMENDTVSYKANLPAFDSTRNIMLIVRELFLQNSIEPAFTCLSYELNDFILSHESDSLKTYVLDIDRHSPLTVFLRSLKSIEIISLLTFQNEPNLSSLLYIDLMVNSTEFLSNVDKLIRLNTLSFLMTFCKAFVGRKPTKSDSKLIQTQCSHPFTQVFLFNDLDVHYPNMDESLESWSNYFMKGKNRVKTLSETSQTFLNLLADYCKQDRNFGFLLLLNCIVTGSRTCYNIDLFKHLIPLCKIKSTFGLDTIITKLINYLDNSLDILIQQARELNGSFPSDIMDIRKNFALLSLIVSVALSSKSFNIERKLSLFSELLCPFALKAVWKINSSVDKLFDTKSDTNIRLRSLFCTHLKTISYIANDSCVVCSYSFIDGSFWKLSDNNKVIIIESLIKSYYYLSSVDRLMITTWLFNVKKNQKDFPSLLPRIYAIKNVSPMSIQAILMNVINSVDSLNVLTKVFSVTMESKYDSQTSNTILCTILMKLVIGTSVNDSKVQKFLFYHTKKLLEFTLESIKGVTFDDSVASDDGKGPGDLLASETCNYLHAYYYTVYKLINKDAYDNSLSVYNEVCSFIHDCLAIFGTRAFNLIQPFIKDMILVSVKTAQRDPDSLELVTRQITLSTISNIIRCDEPQDLSLDSLLKVGEAFNDSSDEICRLVYTDWLSVCVYICFDMNVSHVEQLCFDVIRECATVIQTLSSIIWLTAFITFEHMHAELFAHCERTSGLPALSYSNKGKSVASKLESASNVVKFVTKVVESIGDVLLLDDSLDSFKGKSSYAHISDFMHSLILGSALFKEYAANFNVAKKRKVSKNEKSSVYDVYEHTTSTIRHILRLNIDRCYDRIIYGCLKLFPQLYAFGENPKIASGLENNFWFSECKINASKSNWVLDFLLVTLHIMNETNKNIKVSTYDRNKFSSGYNLISTDLCLILVDFVYYTDLYPGGTSEINKIGKYKRLFWAYYTGLARICADEIQCLLLLCSFTFDKIYSSANDRCLWIYSDMISSVKLLISLTRMGKFSDLTKKEHLYELTNKLSNISQTKLSPYVYKSILMALLALESTLSFIFDSDFHKSILSLVLNFKSSSSTDLLYSFSDKKICDDIFSEYLSINTDKVAELISSESYDANIFKMATDPNIITLLAYYSSVEIRLEELLNMIMVIGPSTAGIETASRLLKMISINIQSKKLKDKYIEDLKCVYFIALNHSLSISFDMLVDLDKLDEENTLKTVANLNKAFSLHDLNKTTKQIKCLSGSMFSSSCDGNLDVTSFEDSFIAFSICYFSNITSRDLVDILEAHLKMLNCDQMANLHNLTSVDFREIFNTDIKNRLLLRILHTTLHEYGEFGTTQLIVPKMYQYIDDVLSFSVSCAELSKTSGGEDLSSENTMWFNNGVLALSCICESITTWGHDSLPEICLNTWLATIRKCLLTFDLLPTDSQDHISDITHTWTDALQKTLLELIFGSSSVDERVIKIEASISENLSRQSLPVKIGCLKILNFLWDKASIHLAATMKNILPELAELLDDDSTTVQQLAKALDDKIQSIIGSND